MMVYRPPQPGQHDPGEQAIAVVADGDVAVEAALQDADVGVLVTPKD